MPQVQQVTKGLVVQQVRLDLLVSLALRARLERQDSRAKQVLLVLQDQQVFKVTRVRKEALVIGDSLDPPGAPVVPVLRVVRDKLDHLDLQGYKEAQVLPARLVILDILVTLVQQVSQALRDKSAHLASKDLKVQPDFRALLELLEEPVQLVLLVPRDRRVRQVVARHRSKHEEMQVRRVRQEQPVCLDQLVLQDQQDSLEHLDHLVTLVSLDTLAAQVPLV